MYVFSATVCFLFDDVLPAPALAHACLPGVVEVEGGMRSISSCICTGVQVGRKLLTLASKAHLRATYGACVKFPYPGMKFQYGRDRACVMRQQCL